MLSQKSIQHVGIAITQAYLQTATHAAALMSRSNNPQLFSSQHFQRFAPKTLILSYAPASTLAHV